MYVAVFGGLGYCGYFAAAVPQEKIFSPPSGAFRRWEGLGEGSSSPVKVVR